MAVDDTTLQNFFSKQKKPKIDALITNQQKKSEPEVRNKEIEQEKTETKLVPNRNQTGTKLVPNRNQTGTKLVPKKEELVPNWYQTGFKTGTKTETKLVPNWYQTGTKTGFFSLTGLQKKISILIYNLCKISRDKKTDAISIVQIANRCESTMGAVKTAIRRLIDKSILNRCDFKNGRGGWTVYSIPNTTYQEILTAETMGKLVPNWYQTGTKLVSELVPELVPTAPSSSSSIYKKTTTTSDKKSSPNNTLPEEWSEIDISPLEKICFTQSHLLQIVSQGRLPPDVVQNSIEAFAFDIEVNKKDTKLQGSALNYFMGVLRKGVPYLPPSNFESTVDRYKRVYNERMAEIEKRRAEEERMAQNFAFREWFCSLSDQEKIKFAPTSGLTADSLFVEGGARKYFLENLWEQRRKEIIEEK